MRKTIDFLADRFIDGEVVIFLELWGWWWMLFCSLLVAYTNYTMVQRVKCDKKKKYIIFHPLVTLKWLCRLPLFHYAAFSSLISRTLTPSFRVYHRKCWYFITFKILQADAFDLLGIIIWMFSIGFLVTSVNTFKLGDS